jgi:3',5'-cyclic AMP phosphodiesterase CpdA
MTAWITHVVVALLAAVLAVAGYRLLSEPNPAGDPRPAAVAGEAPQPLDDPPLVRLAVAGDTGTGDDAERRTVEAMHRVGLNAFDAVVLLGDLIYADSGEPSAVDDAINKPFAPLIHDGAELIPVLGDHEVQAGYANDILKRFGLARSYYVHRLGALRIVVLDTNQVDASQRAWLKKTLARSPNGVRWTIVAMHRPPYSAGKGGSDIDVRDAWTPLFERFKVPLVLAGHSHTYQRSVPIHGVVYVVSGAGAITQPVGSQRFTQVSASVLHFLDVAVYRDRIQVQAIDHHNELVDRFNVG